MKKFLLILAIITLPGCATYVRPVYIEPAPAVIIHLRPYYHRPHRHMPRYNKAYICDRWVDRYPNGHIVPREHCYWTVVD